MIHGLTRQKLLLITRAMSLGLALVFAIAALRFWTTSLPLWNLSESITFLALLTFALLPRKYLALAAARIGIVTLAILALAATLYGVTHSVINLALVGIWPIIVQLVVLIVLASMLAEALLSTTKDVAV